MISKLYGTACAAQVSCPITHDDQLTAGSGDDASGVNHSAGYPRKYGLSPTWPTQTTAERAALMTLIESGNTKAMAVEFLSPVTGTVVTKTCRIVSMSSNNLIHNTLDRWDIFSMELLEN